MNTLNVVFWCIFITMVDEWAQMCWNDTSRQLFNFVLPVEYKGVRSSTTTPIVSQGLAFGPQSLLVSLLIRQKVVRFAATQDSFRPTLINQISTKEFLKSFECKCG